MTSVTSISLVPVPPGSKQAVEGPGEHRFQGVRAIQAGRAYFVTTCPLWLVPEILTFAPAGLPPTGRDRQLPSEDRLPRVAGERSSKLEALSAITASVEGRLSFVGEGSLQGGAQAGQLVIPAGSRILVSDGRHRREAIVTALRARPDLAEESVPLILFAKSLEALSDQQNPVAEIAQRVASEICPFCGLTQLEKASLSNRSSKMFTLSAIRQATAAFLAQRPGELDEKEEALVLEFWKAIGEMIRGWGFIGDGSTAADLRRGYLHVHAVALHALGAVGGELTVRYPRSWQSRLRRLSRLDWRRANPLWDGRAIRNGKISKSNPSLILTANLLRTKVGLELGPTELAIEETLSKEIRVAA